MNYIVTVKYSIQVEYGKFSSEAVRQIENMVNHYNSMYISVGEITVTPEFE